MLNEDELQAHAAAAAEHNLGESKAKSYFDDAESIPTER